MRTKEEQIQIEACQLLRRLRDQVEKEGPFDLNPDNPANTGKVARDRHSIAWHGCFILDDAMDWIRGGKIGSARYYQRIFTRPGRNFYDPALDGKAEPKA